MNYRKLTGVILKKQNYREADQIATVYTQELGKIHCVARGLRSSKSKLMGSFQDFTVVQMEITRGKSMPVLISSKTQQSFNAIRSDLTKMALAFYALELVMKLSADEQANIPVYELLAEFLQTLNNSEAPEAQQYLVLDNFSLRFMESIGFSVEFAKQDFSISADKMALIQQIEQVNSASASEIDADPRLIKQVHKVIGEFIEYIMERNIKSETFLKNI